MSEHSININTDNLGLGNGARVSKAEAESRSDDRVWLKSDLDINLCNYLTVKRVDGEEKLVGSNRVVLDDLDISNDLLVSPAQLYNLLINAKRTLAKQWGIKDVSKIVARLRYIPFSTCVHDLIEKHTSITRKGAYETSYNCLHLDISSSTYCKSFSCDILCFVVGSENDILLHSMFVKSINLFSLIEKPCTPANMGMVFSDYLLRFLS